MLNAANPVPELSIYDVDSIRRSPGSTYNRSEIRASRCIRAPQVAKEQRRFGLNADVLTP
jgi:hypothetical protein